MTTIAVEGHLNHGTYYCYVHYMCRCVPCRTANREVAAAARQARRDSREMIDGRLVATKAKKHGSSATYSNWGCRCLPCTASRRKGEPVGEDDDQGDA